MKGPFLYKDPLLAVILSSFLPGLGQLYARRILACFVFGFLLIFCLVAAVGLSVLPLVQTGMLGDESSLLMEALKGVLKAPAPGTEDAPATRGAPVPELGDRLAKLDLAAMSGWLAVFGVVVWLVSIVHAWYACRKLNRRLWEEEQEQWRVFVRGVAAGDTPAAAPASSIANSTPPEG